MKKPLPIKRTLDERSFGRKRGIACAGGDDEGTKIEGDGRLREKPGGQKTSSEGGGGKGGGWWGGGGGGGGGVGGGGGWSIHKN